MITTEEFNEFCKAHLEEAQKYADMTIGGLVKAQGPINRKYDVENVKHLAVLNALEIAFTDFNPKRSRNQKLSSFLSTVVHNEVLSELGKEGTAVDRFGGYKRRKRTSASDGSVSIMPGVSPSGSDGRIFEPHEYMDIFGSSKGKDIQQRKLLKAYQQLSPMDQTVLHYWMYEEVDDRAYAEVGEKPTRTYVKRAIDELGLDDSWVNAITLRRFKAINKLRAILKGVPVDYEDLYIPGSSDWEIGSKPKKTTVKIYSDEKYSGIGEKMFKKMSGE